MKTGQLFWGFFLLALGALFLLTKYDMINPSYNFIWEIWPLIFVFWGALVIFKHTMVKPFISGLFGIFLAILLFGMIQNLFFEFDFSHDWDHKGNYTEVYNTDFEQSIKSGNLELSSGAGTFYVSGATDKLVDGKASGSLAEYSFDSHVEDTTAYVNFRFEKKHVSFFGGRFRNFLDVKLNPIPVWDINLNTGASKNRLNLGDLKVRNVDVHTGASNVQMEIGDKYDSTNVTVEMGVSKLEIDVPATSGCAIRGDMVLSSRNFPGFVKKESGYFETENFEKSKKKIFIRVDSGVCSISVNRH